MWKKILDRRISVFSSSVATSISRGCMVGSCAMECVRSNKGTNLFYE